MQVSVTISASTPKGLVEGLQKAIDALGGETTTGETKSHIDVGALKNGTKKTSKRAAKRAAKEEADEDEETLDLGEDEETDELEAASDDSEEEDESDEEEETEAEEEEEETPPKKQAKGTTKAAKGPSLEGDIIPAFQKFAKKHSREKAGKVLAKYKVKSVRDLPADKYGEILKTLSA